MQPLYEYVCHMKGHRNSKGELAEWVIKSHETGEILSSHKSEQKAKEHLQHMHIFGESVEGEAACSHCGWSADGVEEYKGRLLCPSCLKEFQRLDANRDANGYIKYDNITKRSDGFNPEGYKLLGESTDGTDMDNRVKIFMEGVSQLGLSKNQVDAIGKITNACMEASGIRKYDQYGIKDADKFFEEAFNRAFFRLENMYGDRLDKEIGSCVVVDKVTGKRFSLEVPSPSNTLSYDDEHWIDVKSGDDIETHPLWINEVVPSLRTKFLYLTDLIVDIFTEELEESDDDDDDDEQPDF